MISTQRLITTAIMLSLILSFASTIYTTVKEYRTNTDSNIDSSIVTQLITQQQAYTDLGSQSKDTLITNESQYGAAKTQNAIQEITNAAINIAYWGGKAILVIGYAFVPLDAIWVNTTNWQPVEITLWHIIIWFRIILIIFIILEIWFIFNSKKTS